MFLDFFSATDDAYRMPMDTAPGLPKIPCHPISARDAEKFLRYNGIWFLYVVMRFTGYFEFS